MELEHKAFWAIKFLNLDSKISGEKRLLQMDELDEFRLQAYENASIYKERTKKWIKIWKNTEFGVATIVIIENYEKP